MEEIINSVMQSPENTNPNVLRSQLQNIGSSGSVGYSVEETRTELFMETTTGTNTDGYYTADLRAEAFDADSVVITFNGTEYACEKIIEHAYDEQGVPTTWYYGANVFIEMGDTIDFSEFPFSLPVTDSVGTMLFTQTAGPNTIKVEALNTTVKVSEDFQLARGYTVEEGRTELFTETVTGELKPIGCYAAALSVQTIEPNSIFATFNGEEYELTKTVLDGSYWYFGAGFDQSGFDFSEYPFSIFSERGTVSLATPTAGTNTIKVETVSETVTPTDEFKAAVAASGSGGGGSLYVVNIDAATALTDKTAGEIFDHRATDRVIFHTIYEGQDLYLQPMCWVQGPETYTVYINVMGVSSAIGAQSRSDYMHIQN